MFMREYIEEIAKALDVDTYSKKLKLNVYLDIMIAQAMEHCTTLDEISALTKVDKHLTSISSSQVMCGEQNQRLPNIRVDIL